ncbi:MAG: KH domain-containing protein [bacterium]
MKQLIEYLVKSMVDNPEEVRIEEHPLEDHTKYQVFVSNEDIGKVIGKNGRIANALRLVIKAAASKDKRRVFLEIVTQQE